MATRIGTEDDGEADLRLAGSQRRQSLPQRVASLQRGPDDPPFFPYPVANERVSGGILNPSARELRLYGDLAATGDAGTSENGPENFPTKEGLTE